ncbi:MAG: DoxX family membrane protein [Rhodomicrobium sp.]|nr:DoxX family membrane protein [Rhodomicrobium sp.]
MQTILRLAPHALSLFMAVIFLDSLRYKFTNHPKTQEIFGRLNDWAGSLGAPGLFAQSGLFSQYVIGGAELVAAIFLIAGLLPKWHHLQAIGAMIGLAIMAGAVSFHLFTPLGVDPNKDGGGLFMAACINLVAALLLLAIFRREEALGVLGRVVKVVAP